MDEAKHRLWDTIIKVVTAVIGLAVALTGLSQYRAESDKNIETQKIERQKLEVERSKLTFDLNRQKAELLSEAAEVASTLATSSDRKEVASAVSKFWKLYYGKLVLVEGPDVATAMVELGHIIEEFKPDTLSFTDEQKAKLKRGALSLSDACKTQANDLTQLRGSTP